MNGWNWQGLVHTLVHFTDVNIEAKRCCELATSQSSILKPVFDLLLFSLVPTSLASVVRILRNRLLTRGVTCPLMRVTGLVDSCAVCCG